MLTKIFLFYKCQIPENMRKKNSSPGLYKDKRWAICYKKTRKIEKELLTFFKK